MTNDASAADNTNVRFEPNERPPNTLAFGLGFQFVLLTVAGIVLTPAIVVRAAGAGEAYLSWAVFAALLICGLTTVLQAARLGPIGSGYVLLMGTSGAFIAVCVTALAQGGPGMLATLVFVSALFQFLLSWRLAWLRRIITPTVAGTVIMLIAVTIMPILFDLLADVPEGTSPAAAPTSVVATLVVALAVLLRGSGPWRLWAPVMAILTGCVVAGSFGLYDVERVLGAAWVGLPNEGWPGLDLNFGPAFWVLLPAFVFVTLVGAIETIGDSVAIQKVSWRGRRATDYRAVQGAVAADGMGNLLSGLAATVPNTTYSSSVAVTEITGVASRVVGVCIGAIFFSLAFLPKITALLLAVPNPVIGAYGIVLIALLFALGVRIVAQDGLDYRKATLVGVAFWIGAGFQAGGIFPDQLGEYWGGLLGNGMTAGGLTALLMTIFIEVTAPRRKRLRTRLDAAAMPEVRRFLDQFSSRMKWGSDATDRLCLVAEEAVQVLVEQREGRNGGDGSRLLVVAGGDGDEAELEFLASSGAGNIEDRMTVLQEAASEAQLERELSLRLLRHFASSVRHQQYQDADILTLKVNVGGAEGAGGAESDESAEPDPDAGAAPGAEADREAE